MVRTNFFVTISIVFFAVLLSLPVSLSPLTDLKERESWERNKVQEWPEPAKYLSAPKEAFQQLEEAINDRQFGGLELIKARRTFYFDHLGVTSDNYVIRNSKGALFLTAPFLSDQRDKAFEWWRKNCLASRYSNHLKNNLNDIQDVKSKVSTDKNRVIFAVVPTKSVVLKNDLPLSTPQRVVDGCQVTTEMNSWPTMLKKEDQSLELLYPLDLFESRASASSLFYPNTSYHWEGESTWAYAEYLAEYLGIELASSFPKSCSKAMVPWDIGGLIGVRKETLGCDRKTAEGFSDKVTPYQLKRPNGSDRLIKIYSTEFENATTDATAVVYANSFGDPARNAIGHVFRKVVHIARNSLSPADLTMLLDQTDLFEADYIIFLGGDFHYPSYLKQIRDAEPQKKSE